MEDNTVDSDHVGRNRYASDKVNLPAATGFSAQSSSRRVLRDLASAGGINTHIHINLVRTNQTELDWRMANTKGTRSAIRHETANIWLVVGVTQATANLCLDESQFRVKPHNKWRATKETVL
jgi:hypothetical protein